MVMNIRGAVPKNISRHELRLAWVENILLKYFRELWMIFHSSVVRIRFIFVYRISLHFSLSYKILPYVYKFRGRVDELSFIDYLSPFGFLLLFFISYKILPYFVYYYCI